VKFLIYTLFYSEISDKRVPTYLREENLEIIKKGKEMRAYSKISKIEMREYGKGWGPIASTLL